MSSYGIKYAMKMVAASFFHLFNEFVTASKHAFEHLQLMLEFVTLLTDRHDLIYDDNGDT